MCFSLAIERIMTGRQESKGKTLMVWHMPIFPSTQEEEAGRSQVLDQPVLHRKFRADQSYMVRLLSQTITPPPPPPKKKKNSNGKNIHFLS
jgi:hypothetical protein